MSLEVKSDTWRSRRRAASIDDIVAVAVRQMDAGGAGALSLGAVARELGIQTPSLYTYFESKAALYDEVFRRGWDDLRTIFPTPAEVTDETDPRTLVRDLMAAVLAWAASHRGHAQLMFWRPIPAWHPSEASFAAAQTTVSRSAELIAALQRCGRLRRDADVPMLNDVLGVVMMGLVSQHLSNDYEAPADNGRVSAHLTALAELIIGPFETRGQS